MAKKAVSKKSKSTSNKPWYKRLLWFFGKIILGLFLFNVGMVVLYRFIPVPFTILQLTRCVEQFQEDKPMVLNKDWEPLENISNKLQLAVVCAEDQKFLNHNGFDIEAIEKAIEHNKKGKKVRGARRFGERVPSVSKRPRMCFYGREERG